MPQPIDFNTEVAKVNAAERAQEVLARVSLAAQQRQAATEQQNQIQTETQVIQTTHTENLAVEEEAKRKNPFVGRRRRRNPERPETQDETSAGATPIIVSQEPNEEHHLDVTV